MAQASVSTQQISVCGQFTSQTDILYTCCLIGTASLTVVAFDKDVWIRDMDSSPSPFPMPILFAFAFPCLARRPAPPLAPAASEALRTPCLCLPGCTCAAKVQHSPPMASLRSPLPPQQPRREGTLSHKSSNSLSQSLVRIPDAAERRASIAVTLNFR